MLISKDLHADILVIYFSKWLIDCTLLNVSFKKLSITITAC